MSIATRQKKCVLPHVIREINNVCRNFMWSGKAVRMENGYVKWQKVYTPKDQRGLVLEISKGGIELQYGSLAGTLA